MQTLTHSPADIVAQMLIDLALGTDPETLDGRGQPAGAWPIYASDEPDAPDNCISVFDTVGRDHGRIFQGALQGHPGFQVRVRAATHAEGWAKADAIQATLAESVEWRTVHVGTSTYEVNAVVDIGDVLALGKEPGTSRRVFFTLNALLVAEEV